MMYEFQLWLLHCHDDMLHNEDIKLLFIAVYGNWATNFEKKVCKGGYVIIFEEDNTYKSYEFALAIFFNWSRWL